MRKIKIKAVPKARPRVTSRGTFMPPNYTKFKTDFARLYRACGTVDKIDNGEVSIVVTFIFEVPKSWTRKMRENPNNTRIVKDLDNLEGGVMDALNGIAYTDDRQVTKIISEKRYGVEDRVEIEVKMVQNDHF